MDRNILTNASSVSTTDAGVTTSGRVLTTNPLGLTKDAGFSFQALRETLAEVERDEANAIEALCAVLERVEQSRDFRCLPNVRTIMKEWQNRPPRGIVTDLKRVMEDMNDSVAG